MASLPELLFYWSVGMLHLKESDVVAPALSLRGPLRNYPLIRGFAPAMLLMLSSNQAFHALIRQ